MSMKSRFVVGCKYAFALFNVFGNETFDVISLECVEEKIVPIEYYENDPNQKTYGYKFKDKKESFGITNIIVPLTVKSAWKRIGWFITMRT